ADIRDVRRVAAHAGQGDAFAEDRDLVAGGRGVDMTVRGDGDSPGPTQHTAAERVGHQVGRLARIAAAVNPDLVEEIDVELVGGGIEVEGFGYGKRALRWKQRPGRKRRRRGGHEVIV